MKIYGTAEDWVDSKTSPYCGRVDDHEPHPWTTPWARMIGREPYQCPGPPNYSVL